MTLDTFSSFHRHFRVLPRFLQHDALVSTRQRTYNIVMTKLTTVLNSHERDDHLITSYVPHELCPRDHRNCRAGKGAVRIIILTL
jgi:hypothetical protein